MNDEVDNELGGRVQKALLDDTSRLDENVTRRLHLSRALALASIKRHDHRTSFFDRQKLVPGVIFACSFLVIFGVGLFKFSEKSISPAKSFDPQAIIQRLDSVEISSAEFELVEELEFYEWLDAHGHAG